MILNEMNYDNSELEIKYIISESIDMIHNIQLAAIKLEHHAVVNNDNDLLNEGAKETVERIIQVIKKTWERVKEWFDKVIKLLVNQKILVDGYLSKLSKNIKNFEGSFEKETYPLKNNKIFESISSAIDSMSNEMKSINRFEKENYFKKHFGVSSIGELNSSINFEKEKIVIDKKVAEDFIKSTKDTIGEIEYVKRNYERIKNSTIRTVSMLESFSQVSPEFAVEASSKMMALNYLYDISTLYTTSLKKVLNERVSVLKSIERHINGNFKEVEADGYEVK